jgi:beta-lactamase regulating signal transducer with metallopeptidase domain
MTIYLWNLTAYTLQLGALVVVALTATWALRIRRPRHLMHLWQTVIAIALLIPLAQPRAANPGGLILLTQSVGGDASAHATRPALDLATIVLAIVLAGIAARLLWLGAGLIRLRRIIARSSDDPASEQLRGELTRATGAVAAIRITDDLDGPATVGVRRPLILLPRSVTGMSDAVQRAIVCHELLHVKRRDWLRTIAEELWCALLWFHPFARIAAARLSVAREMVVDEQTILLTRDRRAYAEALLAFADPQPHIAGATPFIGRRSISQRIAAIAEETTMPHRRAMFSIAVAFVALLGTTAAAVDRVPMSTGAQAATIYEGGGDGVTLPSVVHEVKPQYTAEAMQRKIQGSVWIKAVVNAAGDVVDPQVVRSLDKEYGLDA